VVLEKTEYLSKIEEILNDTKTYKKINKDPTKKLTNKIREILTIWKKKGYITDNTYNTIYRSDRNLLRVYGLSKIHKPGFTFRIIISSVDRPTYSIANFIHGKISKNIVKPHSHIENNYQLVHKLNGLSIEENYELISLDVSLFTNIPLNLVLESVSNKWCQISKGINIPKNKILKALKLILENLF